MFNRRRVSGVLRAPLPLLAQEDPVPCTPSVPLRTPCKPSDIKSSHLLVGVVHVEQREVVAVDVREPRLGLIRRLLHVARAHEHVGHREHRRHGEHLVGALKGGGHREHLAQLRVQRELRHQPACLRQVAVVVCKATPKKRETRGGVRARDKEGARRGFYGQV
eukprot:323377-Prorocentrum_minimum.AAC.1